MKQKADLIRARMKAPRAAAIAGILFSVLLIGGLLLFRLSVRADPLEAGAWLKTSSKTIALALNLIPFAGIAFLWFIGVLRDRLLSGRYIEWILMLFPLWVLLVSIYILIDNLRRPPQVAAISPGK